MLSGVGELAGRLVCAFWLIPCFGYIGRFAAPLFGWGLGGLLMVIMHSASTKSSSAVRGPLPSKA